MTGRSPILHLRCNPAEEAQQSQVGLCGVFHVSIVESIMINMNGRNVSASDIGHTPTSRYRTSRHSAPKSFMRLSASSRRFPEFSHPLVTRGRGISLSFNISTLPIPPIPNSGRPTSALCKLWSTAAQAPKFAQRHQPTHLACNFYTSPSARAHTSPYL